MKSTGNSAMLVATVLVAPLPYLELRYASKHCAQFPYPLFIGLWLVAAASVLVAAPLARAALAGENVLKHPAGAGVRVAFLAVAALFWAGIVIDQWPCFAGVPNCG
jgi:hypothetical protein